MKFYKLLICLLLTFSLLGCSTKPSVETSTSEAYIAEDVETDQKDEVALYIHLYDHLPSNYMTKKEARKFGWESGSLSRLIPGKSIGGDIYGNYEGTLPNHDTYHECDIDTEDKNSRGAKRIVYSEDGDIWYTEDHYDSFELLYGDGK